MIAAVRSFLAEPRPGGAPPWRRWDHVLVALALIGVGLGLAFEPLVTWRGLAVPVNVLAAAALLWRRSHPLLAAASVFGVFATVDLASFLVAGGTPIVAAGGAAGLILVYALWRWGSGRETVVGTVFALAAYVASQLALEIGFWESVVGNTFWMFPAALGYGFRYRANLHARRIAEARLTERQELARELHDTVAHHVSAIAIQAQAGQAVAGTRPESAVDALATIEDQASRTLAEMRRMVGALRDHDVDAETAPAAGLDQIAGLADAPGGPPVEVEVTGDLDGLSPAIEGSVFRLAQEAVTNARRHARHATHIRVKVVGDADTVQLSVADNGDVPAVGARTGYGLVGMAERASLLGGTLEAGPRPDRGWEVQAVLPREASR